MNAVAEVGQVIAGVKLGSFLTPDMASINDATLGSGKLVLGELDVMSGIVF